MREALARSDFDAVRRAPAPARPRRAANPAPQARGPGRATATATRQLGTSAGRMLAIALAVAGGLLLALGQLAWAAVQRWPVSVLGGLTGAAMSVAIIINAVSLQEGQHPSPLFGDRRETAAAANTASARPVATPAAPSRRAADNAVPAPPPTPVARPAAPAREAAAAPAPDAIAQLLATGAPPQAARGPDANGQKAVLAVQQALVKLGYDIKADGLSGPATRRAIEAFEKLEHLPITGDPANETMRAALSTAAGMALD